MKKAKIVILCADDFGLNPGISEGILQLASMQRLSAISCMVNTQAFLSHAPELHSLKKHIKIGLHLNLTEGYFLSNPKKRCFTLNELLIKTHLHLLNLSYITNEFSAQLDQFVATMNRLPDFIDGHQHVHQFPGIRQKILQLYMQKLKENGTSIRSTWPSCNLEHYQFKAKVLRLTGGKALKRQLDKLDIPHNRYFSGIYDFASATNYRNLFREWLCLAKENTLIMCHPGKGLSDTDGIAPARLQELNYFLSDEFLNDCDEHYVHLS